MRIRGRLPRGAPSGLFSPAASVLLSSALLMVNHIQAGLDGKAGGLILLVGIALDELRYHTHGIARRALQAPTGHNAADEHCENVSPVPGK